MAATCNIGLQFPGNSSNAKKKIVLKPRFNSSCNTSILNNKRRLTLVVNASSHSSARRVDTVNGAEDNGTQVQEANLIAGKLENDSAPDTALVTMLRGRFVEDRLVYRQVFAIRSYEIGPDKTVTIETLMNFLQVSLTILIYIYSSSTMFLMKFNEVTIIVSFLLIKSMA